MKYTTLLTFATAALAQLNTIPEGVYIEKHIADSPKTPGSTVTTLKYGPYKVKAGGMIENSKLPAAVKAPCQGCYLTAIEADLEYTDGRKANIDTGAWLHHMVLYNSLGVWGKKDIICTGSQQAIKSGVPTAAIGYPHRIFASGNERAAVRINGKYKYGIPMDNGDGMYVLYELVNESKTDAEYYIVMKFEHVPQTDKEYKRAEMVWADITDCGNSDAPAQEGYYELKNEGWKSTIQGKLLATLGHTHDGGQYTTVYINGKPVCKSDQFYNTRAGYKEGEGVGAHGSMAGMDMGDMDMAGMSHGHRRFARDLSRRDGGHGGHGSASTEHISDVGTCLDFGRLNKGDLVQIGATYNTTKNALQAGHMGDGKWAPIMGISPIYVGLD